MAATLNEHQQFVSVGGKPLVAGNAFYGDPGSDPKTVPKAIFSDPALTLPLANPQLLDAEGRTVNKVYLDGKYSILVENVLGGQEYQNLFNGSPSTGVIDVVSNASGANTITATSSLGITSYVDQQVFSLKAQLPNTGPVTFNVSGIGARPVVKNFDKPLAFGDFQASQTVLVSVNNTNSTFEWINQNLTTVSFYEGAALVAAATTDIWALGDGNTLHISGDTTITSFGTAPNAGARRTIIFDSVLILENSANLALPNGKDFTTSIGDRLEIYADTVTQMNASTPPRLSRGHIGGLQTSKGADADHEISIAIGSAAADSEKGDLVLTVPLVKQINAPWAPGTDAGGLAPNLTLDPDTWYHLHLVDLDAGGTDAGFDTDPDAANLLATTDIGTKFRRIRSVLTDASANIIDCLQWCDNFEWDVPLNDYDNDVIMAATGTPLALSAPLGVKTIVKFNFASGVNSMTTLMYSPDTTGALPVLSGVPVGALAANVAEAAVSMSVLTDLLSQIVFRPRSALTNTAEVTTTGYVDRRGKDD